MVPGAGIEPAQPQGPRDFKSLASTSSATQARKIILAIASRTSAVKDYVRIHRPSSAVAAYPRG